MSVSERSMQAAGRLPSHTYADLRSARRAYQRTRKHPRKTARREHYCCNICAPSHHTARLQRTKEVHAEIASGDWEHVVDAEEVFHDDLRSMDDVVYMQRFGVPVQPHAPSQLRSQTQLKAGDRRVVEGRDYAWHRNASGCWEIGYPACGWGSFPCACCCTGNGSMYFECRCKEFGVGEVWEVRAPEDGGRARLVEWAKGTARDILAKIEVEDDDAEADTEWVLLEESEDAWSVVSEESDVSLV